MKCPFRDGEDPVSTRTVDDNIQRMHERMASGSESCRGFGTLSHRRDTPGSIHASLIPNAINEFLWNVLHIINVKLDSGMNNELPAVHSSTPINQLAALQGRYWAPLWPAWLIYALSELSRQDSQPCAVFSWPSKHPTVLFLARTHANQRLMPDH